MEKSKFASYFNPVKIDEIASSIKKECHYKALFRFIKHSYKTPLQKEDFCPSIMEHNKPPYTMPDYEKQLIYPYDRFSTSCCVSIEGLRSLIETIPAMRNCPNSCIAKGSTDVAFGIADKASKSGHVNYYLYDPLSFPTELFKIVESVKENG